MERRTVLLIGSGGREHALAWKLAQSNLLDKLYTLPGNSGTAMLGENIPLQDDDFGAIKKVVLEKGINMVVPGPETPLVNGIHDFFLADPLLREIPVIGPVRSASRLEGSKEFAKKFMARYGIPTAAFRSFGRGQETEAIAFLDTFDPPYVIKADGLAAGKGVVIAENRDEAMVEIHGMLGGDKFGKAGQTIVIEEYLHGIELSVFILTDGVSYLMLPSAKDYKRIGDGDTGPNTGGMGAVSPVPFAGDEFNNRIERLIIQPTLEGLSNEGIDYSGFIFFGLMNVNGNPYVIEYNARLGDPEAEVVLPRVGNDLLELFNALAARSLSGCEIKTDPRYACCLIAAAPGYPGSYPKGMAITGLPGDSNATVFHAGTRLDPETGNYLTSGGRVLAATALGSSLCESMTNAYRLMHSITFEGMYFRTDIGRDLLEYHK